ncbi:Putative Cobalt uptake protein COT1 [Rhizopus microsporus]|nr:Putative Cobalt uptake protein COT1 [Rhizopus microsporus]
MLSRKNKIYFMLVITTCFFFVEIVIGYYVSSLALIADSFHMLNDLLSMCIALWAINVASSTKYDPRYSYGWQRAEILGALINGVFLLALCFTILIDSIERFVSPEEIKNPIMVLVTGGAGLLANVVGLFLFHDHGHSHGHSDPEKGNHGHHGGGHLNMKGIFLHVLGDALGNVGVIASALFIWLTPFSWRFYFDPLVSILITIIIFTSALPLVRQTASILLQGVPKSVPLSDVHESLVKLDGVLSVHELHVWQLSDTKLIASLHVLIESREKYMDLASQIRGLLHSFGIHSATIQPEFIDDKKIDQALSIMPKEENINQSGTLNDTSSDIASDHSSGQDLQNSSTCLLRCTEDSCLENNCCPPLQNETQ